MYNFKMTDFYTRTGDDGTSSLLGNQRVPKDHPRLEAVGALDETNAALGIARATCNSERIKAIIIQTQRDLYHLMAEVAATPENAARFRVIDAERVVWLEQKTSEISADVDIPKEFIIPGDTLVGARLDLARTIIRRAERRVAHLIHAGEVENRELLRYLNRLSSLCFVLELAENSLASENPISLQKSK
jgi:cob(I)alamin adenosyltransferase